MSGARAAVVLVVALGACGRSSSAGGRGTETGAAPAAGTAADAGAEAGGGAESGAGVAADSGASADGGTGASASALCVTEGAVTAAGQQLTIDAPKVRAVSAFTTDQTAELRFTYLGPTTDTAALGSGAVRRQIGLKLRAQDGCNLVYAMWRFEPRNEVVVQVKRNPGQATSAECANRGYRTVRARRGGGSASPDVAAGSSHVLRAQMRGADLAVWADGAVVWEGSLGDDALAIDGPVGLRSDNVRVAFTFAPGSDGSPRTARACPHGVGGGE